MATWVAQKPANLRCNLLTGPFCCGHITNQLLFIRFACHYLFASWGITTARNLPSKGSTAVDLHLVSLACLTRSLPQVLELVMQGTLSRAEAALAFDCSPADVDALVAQLPSPPPSPLSLVSAAASSKGTSSSSARSATAATVRKGGGGKEGKRSKAKSEKTSWTGNTHATTSKNSRNSGMEAKQPPSAGYSVRLRGHPLFVRTSYQSQDAANLGSTWPLCGQDPLRTRSPPRKETSRALWEDGGEGIK